MGLFSDILEEINERGFAPVMTAGWSFQPTRTYYYPIVTKQEVGKRVKRYIPHPEDFKERKATTEEIRKDLNDLENIKFSNRMNEKQILYARNKCMIKSIVVNDLLDEMLTMIEETCSYINLIKNRITTDKIVINYTFPEINESQLRGELLSTIYWTLYISIKRGLPMDVSLFRKIVKDLIQLTSILDSSSQGKVDKYYVENYFSRMSGEKAGDVVCHNCGRPLIKTIPYCFNCFEGRYS